MPAGTVLGATTWIARLYERHCTRGQRLQLAEQLVASNVQAALVRIGPVTPANGDAATASAAVAPPPPPKPAKPKTHRVVRGENLTTIARRYRCDLGDLAKANKLKAPKYAVKPGQSISLQGCDG